MVEGEEGERVRTAERRRATKEVIVKERRTWRLSVLGICVSCLVGYLRLRLRCRHRSLCWEGRRCSSLG